MQNNIQHEHLGPENPEQPEQKEGQADLTGEEGLQHKHAQARGARGTAAMDPQTRQEVARKGGLAVSRNRQHLAEIGRKGGQAVSKNREHMAEIGRKGGESRQKKTSAPS